MGLVRLLCASSLLFACGTSASQDAGVDASSQDSAASDAGADVVITDPECIEAGVVCQQCCSTVHPDASGIFDTMMGACTCADGGACETACASSLCSTSVSNKTCDSCVSKQCYPNAQKACNADPACKAWLACLVPCP